MILYCTDFVPVFPMTFFPLVFLFFVQNTLSESYVMSLSIFGSAEFLFHMGKKSFELLRCN